MEIGTFVLGGRRNAQFLMAMAPYVVDTKKMGTFKTCAVIFFSFHLSVLFFVSSALFVVRCSSNGVDDIRVQTETKVHDTLLVVVQIPVEAHLREAAQRILVVERGMAEVLSRTSRRVRANFRKHWNVLVFSKSLGPHY